MLFGLSYMPGLFEVNWGELLPIIAKVVNLLLFVVAMYFVLRRPLAEAFRARQEGIQHDLLRAEEERSAAVAKLHEVEERLARLGSEVEAIQEQTQREAAEERSRIERAAEEEVRKIREQARREIESASKAARAELRAYAAEQSVRMAEEMIRREIRPEDDAHLVGEYVEELGGVGR
jgi:F-type H+-transporting ATPase subunit b